VTDSDEPKPERSEGSERRQRERRTDGDRRKKALGPTEGIERREGDRRKRDRRRA